MVTAHGGNITLDTAVGSGTTFNIVLPLGKPFSLNTQRPVSTRRVVPKTHSVTLGETGLVLLVEDESFGPFHPALLTQAGHQHSVASGKCREVVQ